MPTVTLNLPTTPDALIKTLVIQKSCVTITGISITPQNPNLPFNTECIIFRVLGSNVGQSEMKIEKWYVLAYINMSGKDLPLTICKDFVKVEIIRNWEAGCEEVDISNILVEVKYNY